MGPEGPTVILAHGYEGNKSTMLAHAALLTRTTTSSCSTSATTGRAATRARRRARAERRAGRGRLARPAEGPGRSRCWVSRWAAHRRWPNRSPTTGSTRSSWTRPTPPWPMPSRPAWTWTASRSRSRVVVDPARLADPHRQDISAADPVQRVAHYGSRPLLIIEGGQDDLIGSTIRMTCWPRRMPAPTPSSRSAAAGQAGNRSRPVPASTATGC